MPGLEHIATVLASLPLSVGVPDELPEPEELPALEELPEPDELPESSPVPPSVGLLPLLLDEQAAIAAKTNVAIVRRLGETTRRASIVNSFIDSADAWSCLTAKTESTLTVFAVVTARTTASRGRVSIVPSPRPLVVDTAGVFNRPGKTRACDKMTRAARRISQRIYGHFMGCGLAALETNVFACTHHFSSEQPSVLASAMRGARPASKSSSASRRYGVLLSRRCVLSESMPPR
jgi:hypothetical protein